MRSFLIVVVLFIGCLADVQAIRMERRGLSISTTQTQSLVSGSTSDDPLQSINAPIPLDQMTPLERTEALIAPKWEYCNHTSPNSYVNFTFSPYPILRGQYLNVSLEGFIDAEIVEGTTLEMTSSHARFSIIKGPSVKIDVCTFIAEKYPNAPDIRCPINKWAIMLVLYGISQTGGVVGSSKSVPKIIIPGNYNAKVELKTKYEVLTCAQTVIYIE